MRCGWNKVSLASNPSPSPKTLMTLPSGKVYYSTRKVSRTSFCFARMYYIQQNTVPPSSYGMS